MARKSDRFSVETDSTIKDIWTFSQRPSSEFNPDGMKEAIDYKRQLRAPGREGMYSLTNLLEGDSPVPRQGEVSRAMKRRSQNLQKSIALLDDAVGTPSSILRSSRKTPRMLRHTNYTPQNIPSASRFEVSSMLGFATPGGSVMATPGTLGSLNESNMEGIQASPGFRSANITQAGLDEGQATSNVALLLDDDPTITDCNGMFGDFLQTMQANASEHQLFQLLGDYEKICADNVGLLKKLNKNTVPGHHRSMKILDMYELLNQEKCTWRLILSLYRDRLDTEARTAAAEGDDMLHSMTAAAAAGADHVSAKRLVSRLYETEAAVRQAQLVVDWLERGAVDQIEDCYDRVEFFTDGAWADSKSGGGGGGAAWENTLHELRQAGLGNPLSAARGTGSGLVTALDPDAPLRQHLPLADLDTEDDLRLLKYLFNHVRSGQLDEAQKLCTKVGQPWRAATLEGWRLYHDPNQAGETEKGYVAKVEGNPYRDVWKAVGWRMCKQENLNVYEKALYSVYSGDLDHLLPACDTWEDHMWAYFKIFVDRRVEEEIRLNLTTNRPLHELPKGYTDKLTSIENIFQEIQASPNDGIRMQSREQFHVVQKYIILDDVDSLLEEMYEWSRDDREPPQPHFLRFMAHLVLFFRMVGVSSKEELMVGVLEAYVRHLVSQQPPQIELVAPYVAALPQHAQVDVYASFLRGIHDRDQRKLCLELAESASLDVPSITKVVVENIRKTYGSSSASMMGLGDRGSELPGDGGDLGNDAGINQEDREKIEGLEWLVFDVAQRPEAMRQACALMRTFLTVRKMVATKAVFQKLPEDSIDVIHQLWKKQTGSSELRAEDENAIREYLCIKSYLDAHDSFNDWFQHFHNAKPARPEMPQGATFTERVAHEHREKQYEAELDRWEHALMLQSETTVEKLYNVLLFPNGGWMVDARDDAPVDPSSPGRTHQLRLLRQLCLPNLAFLLLTVLHSTGQEQRALQLADVVAAEYTALYKVFNKDELQRFLQKIQESAIANLEKNLDPFGYPIPKN